jgi:hypothetical protein
LAALIAVSSLLGFLAVAAGVLAAFSAQAAACTASPDEGSVPPAFMPFYVGAAERFGLGPSGWAYLAAINAVESDFDDTALAGVASGANPFGAAGPMQIGIGGAAGDTWSTVAVADVPGGAAPPSVYDEADAVYAAANLLHLDGAPGDWAAAVFAYNHASWYVSRVRDLATRYLLGPATAVGSGCTGEAPTVIAGSAATIGAGGSATIPAQAPAAVQQMLAAGNRIIAEPYSYGGGHVPAAMGVPPDPAAEPGTQENGGPGYDCSSAVDYVLWGAGLGSALLGGAVPGSAALATVGEPGPGRWVTIYAGASGGQPHAFIAVDGLVLDTVHLEPTAPAGTGLRWQSGVEVQRELATGDFVARHPAGL